MMFKWSPLPFLRFSLALAAGILVAHYFPILWARSFATLYLLLFCFVLVLVAGKSFFTKPVVGGILALLVLGYSGGLMYKMDKDRRWSSHFTHVANIDAFSGTVAGDIKQTSSGWRFIGELSEVVVGDSLSAVSGRVQIYVREPALQLEIGDEFYAMGRPQAFRLPGNPGQFDYGQYMEKDDVYAQIFLSSKDFREIATTKPFSILAFSARLRGHIVNDMQAYFNDQETLQIAMALLIGVKEDLSSDLRSAYATAGATHVLAVSGLHVGIVYLLLIQVFGRLKKAKYGRFLFFALVVASIWLYALITGMSASVTRSAGMFTILALGESTGNDRNIYNTLGIAAFCLLAYRPAYLFDLGFQFSFLAVFGIVYLFPKVNSWFVPSNWLLKQAWDATCVSFSAQIAVAPLSILYFHQFPLYFLLTNLVVVVFAYGILIVGIPMIVIGSIIPMLGLILAFPLEIMIVLLNWLIRAIEALPASSVTGLAISTPQALLFYGFLVAILWSMEYKRFAAFALSCVFLVGFMVRGYAAEVEKRGRLALIVYDMPGAFALDLHNGAQAILLGEGLTPEGLRRHVDPSRLHWRYDLASDEWRSPREMMVADSLLGTLHWQGLGIARIHGSLSKLALQDTLRSEILIISNNARITQAQWSRITCEHLIFDGSNDYWYVRSQEPRLAKAALSSHFVRRDGFWELDLSKTKQQL